MNGPVRTVGERDGAWLRVILDRPRGNLLSLEMVRAAAAAMRLAVTPGRKWVTIEGAGADFSFGASVQEHAPGIMEMVLPETHALIRDLLALPVATAALVRGRCLGGGFELALACDAVFAEEDAILGLPEITLAAFPPAAAALLPLRAGATRASEAVLTGRASGAAEWAARGIVTEIVAPGTLVQAAGQWFDAHLRPRSAVALAAAAQAARLPLRAIGEPALAAAERLYLERLLPSHDAHEGVRAFVEKRAPQWKDR